MCRGVGALLLSCFCCILPQPSSSPLPIWFCILISTVVHTSMFLLRSLDAAPFLAVITIKCTYSAEHCHFLECDSRRQRRPVAQIKPLQTRHTRQLTGSNQASPVITCGKGREAIYLCMVMLLFSLWFSYGTRHDWADLKGRCDGNSGISTVTQVWVPGTSGMAVPGLKISEVSASGVAPPVLLRGGIPRSASNCRLWKPSRIGVMGHFAKGPVGNQLDSEPTCWRVKLVTR
ncbi:hypothetical protein BGW80DRAFT_670118 [Lactifluus volemus]|nr:hypothetical protein BGW80DRAFT_670118 [Lactifluus volemus]